MLFPSYTDTPVGKLIDLPDERRAKKWSGLPADGLDVSAGLVQLKSFPGLSGNFPICKDHGAMLSIAQEGHVWRCGEIDCGIGAIYRRR